MIAIFGFLAGALYGGFLAKRRKGTRFDIAQYAGGFGIAFGLLGMVLTVLIERLL